MRGSCAVLVCCLLQGLNAAYYQQIIAYGNDISDFQKHEESQTTTTGLGNDGGGGGSNQDDTPAPPPHDQTARMSRFLVHYSDWLSMATISTRGSLTGTPFANVFSFSDGPTDNSTGVIYMYLTEMEMSVKDLHRNTKASVTISMEQVAQGKYCKDLDAEDPRCAHIILAGDVAHIKKDTPEYFFAKKSLFSRHPIMPSWPEWHGWGFAKLKLTNIILLDYFGGAIDVPIKDYYNVKM